MLLFTLCEGRQWITRYQVDFLFHMNRFADSLLSPIATQNLLLTDCFYNLGNHVIVAYNQFKGSKFNQKDIVADLYDK